MDLSEMHLFKNDERSLIDIYCLMKLPMTKNCIQLIEALF